jgi:hypothetical protein
MNLSNLSHPFYHTIIHNFYDDEEQKLIWEELEFLNKPNKLLSPDRTGDLSASFNKRSIFLEELYTYNRQVSNILTVNKKIFNIIDLMKENIFSNYLGINNRYQTMISYYEDKAYYSCHHDSFTMSSVTTFWKEPKKFSGGDLRFVDFDYTPEMYHNSMIIFPSFVNHEVTPVCMENNDGINGRYTINQFYTIIS